MSNAYSQVARLAVRRVVAGVPSRIRGQRLIAMIQCFVDDSGTDPEPNSIFVLAGYVMDEARWEDFADHWDAELRKQPEIDYFRMADAEEGEGPFRGIEEPFRKMKVRDLAKVVRQHCPTPLAVRLKWDDYFTIVKGNVDPRLDNPYAFLFFKVLAINFELQRQLSQVSEFSFKPVNFVFDDQGPAGLKCLDWYGALKQRVSEPQRTVIANTPDFRDDRDVKPLQAADMLAWHLRRGYSYENEDRTEVFGMLNPLGMVVYTYEPEEIHRIVNAWKTRLDPSTI